MIKKIFIGSDHAGFHLKQNLIKYLNSEFRSIQLEDVGPQSTDSVDYPDYAHKVCEKVLSTDSSRGLLICGSGQGMSITANKYKGIRAALCWEPEVANLARAHNDANVLCLSARLISEDINKEILKTFLETDFEGGRHLNRLQKI